MPSHVLAVDQGTTGTTVLLLDAELRVRGRVTREFPQVYPRPGWVEHDPEAIWRTVVDAVGACLHDARVAAADVAGIGITNQRETTVVWERASGGRATPVHNAIVWQCRRTADRCAELRAAGAEAAVRERTGLVLDPYFSGTKIDWILQNVPGARARAERGELAFGTIDSWLVWRLTGGAAHVTDVSNASRTMLLDLRTRAWSDEMLALLRVPRAVLPEVRGCAETYGTTRGVESLPDGLPVAGMAGDQQAALFGQACFDAGEAKCTFGTGAFLLMNTGERVVPSHSGLLTTVAWTVGGRTAYALEGSAFVAGAAVQWLRDGLGLIARASDVEALAASVPDAGGVVFVPALTGLGAPWWRAEARGVLHGLTRDTGRGHIARACLEGIALQNQDLLAAMARDLGAPLQILKVDGGAAANDLLMQLQADVLGVPISRPAMLETTALGAALLAGLGVGLWKELSAVRAVWKEERRFTPARDRMSVEAMVARWHEVVAKA
ncbi:MAG TPA: glycerol kinase GlpK [Myxococcota bacterium]|nr:glycerol kinase GlpK [Myxococcota bacterium]